MANNVKIGFIGGGNMATCIIGGLIAAGTSAADIFVADHSSDKMKLLQQQFGINTAADANEIATKVDVLILAVKPQNLKQAVLQLKNTINLKKPLIISVAAGVTTAAITSWIENDIAIVRAMPNTPALVQTGATGLYANHKTSKAQKQIAESTFRTIGIIDWVTTESHLDIITALSGSGPAYFFLMMHELQQAAINAGLDKQCARLFTLQTAQGAARIALESKKDFATLQQQVTSPGGTTAAALEILKNGDFGVLIADAIKAATARSVELSQQFGEN